MLDDRAHDDLFDLVPCLRIDRGRRLAGALGQIPETESIAARERLQGDRPRPRFSGRGGERSVQAERPGFDPDGLAGRLAFDEVGRRARGPTELPGFGELIDGPLVVVPALE